MPITMFLWLASWDAKQARAFPELFLWLWLGCATQYFYFDEKIWTSGSQTLITEQP